MDNHIIDQWAKDELAHREIKPSVSVWDRLETELETPTPPVAKPKNYAWFWMGMLSLALLTGAFYLYQTSVSEEKQSSETKTEVKTQNVSDSPMKAQSSDVLPEYQNISKEFQKPEALPVTKKSQKMPFFPAPANLPAPQKANAVKEVQQEVKEPTKESEIFASETTIIPSGNVSLPIEQHPSKEVKPAKTKKKKSGIDAAALLAQVDQQPDIKSKKYNIDPNVLLKEAEKGANERFLQKMFKTLSHTSTAVVTAVNNRNTEL